MRDKMNWDDETDGLGDWDEVPPKRPSIIIED